MQSAELAKQLAEIEGNLWGEWKNNKPIIQITLARESTSQPTEASIFQAARAQFSQCRAAEACSRLAARSLSSTEGKARLEVNHMTAAEALRPAARQRACRRRSPRPGA
jgi:hypothetical protein